MVLCLSTTISAITDQGISLALEDGQAVMLAKDSIVPLPKVGDRYTMTIMTEEAARLDQEDLARTMLNQLIPDVPVQGQNTPEEAARA
jgi:hypothetical protein